MAHVAPQVAPVSYFEVSVKRRKGMIWRQVKREPGVESRHNALKILYAEPVFHRQFFKMRLDDTMLKDRGSSLHNLRLSQLRREMVQNPGNVGYILGVDSVDILR